MRDASVGISLAGQDLDNIRVLEILYIIHTMEEIYRVGVVEEDIAMIVNIMEAINKPPIEDDTMNETRESSKGAKGRDNKWKDEFNKGKNRVIAIEVANLTKEQDKVKRRSFTEILLGKSRNS